MFDDDYQYPQDFPEPLIGTEEEEAYWEMQAYQESRADEEMARPKRGPIGVVAYALGFAWYFIRAFLGPQTPEVFILCECCSCHNFFSPDEVTTLYDDGYPEHYCTTCR